MKRPPPEDAAAKAEAWLRDNGFTSLPIDLVKVAEFLEIPVHPLAQSKPGVSGMLHRDGDQFVIMFGTYIKSIGFQRFSIAHELGHYLLSGHPEHLFPPGVTSHSSQAGFTSADLYEQEADYFGLNTAREPYGFAMAAMRLSSYRKMQPSALEEIIFFDHPSGHTRIYDSMRWLKENPSAADQP